jgi:hypothetical protein
MASRQIKCLDRAMLKIETQQSSALALRQHPISFRSALSSQTCTTLSFAWLFVVLAAAHFLLDAASLNELSEPTNGFLD